MAFITIADFVADGMAQSFAVPFPYLAEPHVIVTVDDAPVPFSFTSAQVVELDDIPLNGTTVRVRRQTPIDRLLVVIASRSTVRSTEVNQLALQLLYIIQESFDASLDFQSTLLDRSIELSVSGSRLAAGERSPPIVVGQALELPAGLPGTRFATFDPPTGNDPHTLDILRGPLVIGSVALAPNTGEASVTFENSVVLGRGDVLSLRVTSSSPVPSFGVTFQGTLI